MSAVADHESLTVKTPDLPEPVMRRGITESQWRTLFNLFPGAKPDSALMVWDYCRSRQLDPMKKPCHIVPMRVKVNGEWMWRGGYWPSYSDIGRWVYEQADAMLAERQKGGAS